MKLHGTDLISRATQNTFRTVLLFSAAALAITEFGLNSQNLEFFVEPPSQSQQRWIVTGVLAFSVMSHVVHWFFDYVIYSSWFRHGDARIVGLASVGPYKDREHILVSLGKRLDGLKVSERVDLENIKERVKNLEDLLNDIGPGFRRMKWATRFDVFGWYLILPLCLGLAAIFRAQMIGG